MLTIDDLNTNQRTAANWDEGSLLVLAGPGSGKTAVLTLRIARLIEQQPDAAILGLTFTHKAAAEMRVRILAALDQALTNLGRADTHTVELLLPACAAAIASDGIVSQAQGELMRAIADSLGAPMPPLLPGQRLA